MSSSPISSRAIWGIVSIALVLVVLGLCAYLYFVLAKVPEVPPKVTQYDTSFIADMQVADATKNIYARAAILNQVTTSTDESIKYTASDLGKTDITKFGSGK